ncbi:MAG: Flp family type IVb pilin [Stellaceae bacterium]
MIVAPLGSVGHLLSHESGAVLLARRDKMPPGIAVMMDRIRSAPMALGIDRSGATVIEYALIAGIISISILIWAFEIGTAVSGFFTTMATSL